MATNQCFFNNDPLYMKALVGKSVKVSTCDNNTYEGFLYVIDPSSKTVVLAKPNPDSSKFDLDFILYHSIESFKVVDNHPTCNDFVFETETRMNNPDMENKKQRLKSWLKENLIDVEEEEDCLSLGGILTIEYPYGPDQCFCSNPIVLEKIKTIIGNMPKEDLM